MTCARSLVPQAKSKLDTTTLDLMSLIFDEDVALQAMKAMNIDPEKLPLGALSRTQIDRGCVRCGAARGMRRAVLAGLFGARN